MTENSVGWGTLRRNMPRRKKVILDLYPPKMSIEKRKIKRNCDKLINLYIDLIKTLLMFICY